MTNLDHEPFQYTAGIEVIYPNELVLTFGGLAAVLKFLEGRAPAIKAKAPNHLLFGIGINNGDSETAKQDTEALMAEALQNYAPQWQVLRCTRIIAIDELDTELTEIEGSNDILRKRNEKLRQHPAIVTPRDDTPLFDMFRDNMTENDTLASVTTLRPRVNE